MNMTKTSKIQIHFNVNFSFLPFQIETIYKKAHSAIRADPVYKKKAAKKVTKKRWNLLKLTLEQRKTKIAAHKADFIAKIKAGAD